MQQQVMTSDMKTACSIGCVLYLGLATVEACSSEFKWGGKQQWQFGLMLMVVTAHRCGAPR